VAVEVTGREEIVRDILASGETRRARPLLTLTGIVVERTAAGKKPVAGAEVQEVVTRCTGNRRS